MGTKVEYSINLLANSAESNNLTVDVWEHCHNKGLTNNLLHRTGINCRLQQDPIMDRMLDRNNIEYIKKTMQMHEDIFKHQVRELHRVYNVQKMLMNELKKQQHFGINVSHPHFTQTSHGLDHHFHAQSLRSRERSSGSCSGDTIKFQRGFEFDLERPAELDECEAGPSSYTALKNCKTSSSVVGVSDVEMEVDLTLSIGGSSKVKKPHVPHELECSLDSPNGKTRDDEGVGGECNDPTTPMSSSSVTFSQKRKGPHWLSQGLKLK